MTSESAASALLRGSLSDPLAETLHLLRLGGALYFQSELSAPWGFEMPLLPGCVSFHMLLDGECQVRIGAQAPVALVPGVLVVLPLGSGHVLTSEAGVATPKVEDLPHHQLSDRYAVLRLGGGGAVSTLFCGALQFGHPAAERLVAMLPELIWVDNVHPDQLVWMRSTMALLASEASSPRPGSEALAVRLADLILCQAIRQWVASDPDLQRSWLAAVRDEQIAEAMTLIHANPGRSWTVADLADELGMSRSVFAARFTEMVNEPAMQYVTRWKMQLAFSELSELGTSVALVADRLGYQSEASFSRAFKRVMGFSPGKAKGLHRHQRPLVGASRRVGSDRRASAVVYAH